jgi:hypothetical protein
MEPVIKTGGYNFSTLTSDDESLESSCNPNRNHVELAHKFIQAMEESNEKIVVARTKQEIMFNINHNKLTYELTKRAQNFAKGIATGLSLSSLKGP